MSAASSTELRATRMPHPGFGAVNALTLMILGELPAIQKFGGQNDTVIGDRVDRGRGAEVMSYTYSKVRTVVASPSITFLAA